MYKTVSYGSKNRKTPIRNLLEFDDRGRSMLHRSIEQPSLFRAMETVKLYDDMLSDNQKYKLAISKPHPIVLSIRRHKPDLSLTFIKWIGYDLTRIPICAFGHASQVPGLIRKWINLARDNGRLQKDTVGYIIRQQMKHMSFSMLHCMAYNLSKRNLDIMIDSFEALVENTDFSSINNALTIRDDSGKTPLHIASIFSPDGLLVEYLKYANFETLVIPDNENTTVYEKIVESRNPIFDHARTIIQLDHTGL